jgi:HEPN domain-containing protein
MSGLLRGSHHVPALVFHSVRFHKTHFFEKLAAEVEKIDTPLAKLILKRKSMIKLAITYRYPDAEKKPLTLGEAKAAIKHAEELYDQCYRRVYGAQ